MFAPKRTNHAIPCERISHRNFPDMIEGHPPAHGRPSGNTAQFSGYWRWPPVQGTSSLNRLAKAAVRSVFALNPGSSLSVQILKRVSRMSARELRYLSFAYRAPRHQPSSRRVPPLSSAPCYARCAIFLPRSFAAVPRGSCNEPPFANQTPGASLSMRKRPSRQDISPIPHVFNWPLAPLERRRRGTIPYL